MAPDGTIGAVRPYQVAPEETPEGMEERSFLTLRAEFQSVVEATGRSMLLAEAMMDPDVVISSREAENGTIELVRGDEGQVVSEKGGVLTLTASEAVEYGLALGTADEPEAAAEVLGIDEYYRMRAQAARLVLSRGKQARLAHERQSYMEKIAPDLERIDEALDRARAKGRAAVLRRQQLQKQYDSEVSDVHESYERDLEDADDWERQYGTSARFMRQNARRRRDARLQAINSRYQPLVAEVQGTIAEMKEEQERLLAEREQLLQGAPP